MRDVGNVATAGHEPLNHWFQGKRFNAGAIKVLSPLGVVAKAERAPPIAIYHSQPANTLNKQITSMGFNHRTKLQLIYQLHYLF